MAWNITIIAMITPARATAAFGSSQPIPIRISASPAFRDFRICRELANPRDAFPPLLRFPVPLIWSTPE